jgi:hypothetical protein
MKTTIAVLKDAGELTVSGLVFVTLVMTISRTNLLMSDLLYMLFLLVTFPYLIDKSIQKRTNKVVSIATQK